jgi:VanZ family protein
MFVKADPDLKYRFLWLAMGYALIIAVVFLSLTSNPIDMDTGLSFEDKLFHALAYFVLMFWFGQIYHDKFQRNMIAMVFIFMGFTLEYLQSFDVNRFSEFGDMVANVAGVALGFYLMLTGAKNLLLKVERIIT